MPFAPRAILPLALVAALLCGSAIPAAGAADAGPDAVAAAKKKGKCKKGKGKKARKCKRASSPTGTPGLPGQPLKPGTPTAPPVPAVPTVSDVSVITSPVLGAAGSQGEVTISEPAPSGGQPVELSSDQAGRASVPDSVHVAAGQTKAGFAISTTAGPTVTATITASIGSSARDAQITIVAQPSVIGVELDYKCFPGSPLVDFGDNRVRVDVPVPADTAVSLASGDPFSLTTPSSVTVLEDSKVASFGVDTLQTMATPFDVTATLGSSSASDSAIVRDLATPDSISGLGLNPGTVVAGASSVGTVTLGCEALSGGATVALSSDNPGVTVPPTVTVPAGSLTATFPITTDPAATGEAVISATLGGTQQATLLLDQLGT